MGKEDLVILTLILSIISITCSSISIGIRIGKREAIENLMEQGYILSGEYIEMY
jgi:hypothetical protein